MSKKSCPLYLDSGEACLTCVLAESDTVNCHGQGIKRIMGGQWSAKSLTPAQRVERGRKGGRPWKNPAGPQRIRMDKINKAIERMM